MRRLWGPYSHVFYAELEEEVLVGIFELVQVYVLFDILVF